MKYVIVLNGKPRVFEVTPWSWTVGQLMQYVAPPRKQRAQVPWHRKPATVGIG